MDDGGGVAPAHVHQLFDPFFSSRSSQGGKGHGKGHGTGLGLAIVAGVAADHAGGVAVWTGRGERTRFCLMLPLLTAQEAAQLPLIAPPAPLGRGETVLVVAQDEAARERTEDTLAALGFEPAGYDPAAVAGGPQGMEAWVSMPSCWCGWIHPARPARPTACWPRCARPTPAGRWCAAPARPPRTATLSSHRKPAWLP
jgi:hypothetical protein